MLIFFNHVLFSEYEDHFMDCLSMKHEFGVSSMNYTWPEDFVKIGPFENHRPRWVLIHPTTIRTMVSIMLFRVLHLADASHSEAKSLFLW